MYIYIYIYLYIYKIVHIIILKYSPYIMCERNVQLERDVLW